MANYYLLEGEKVATGISLLSELIRNSLSNHDKNLQDVNLGQLHRLLTPETVNRFRLATFQDLNSSLGAHDGVIEQIAGDALRYILGPDLLIQSKLNLSIQLPGDTTSNLDLHSDCWSGDTPFQVNLWIPLTPCFSTNSMFLLSEEISFKCIEKIRDQPTVFTDELLQYVSNKDFLKLSFGQAIIFNPGLIHGNTLNTTTQTRVSINVRFKSLFSPDARVSHISRSAGPYYRIFRLSDWTRLAISLDEINQNINEG